MAFSDQDRAFMWLAVAEAAKDPRIFKVGAVITRGSSVLATGHGEEFHGFHAERAAIRKSLEAGTDLSGATLYTTLEPCVPDARKAHRQPCAVEILNQPFHRVVIGVLDPNPNVRRKGLLLLSSQSTIDVDLCTNIDIQNAIRQLSKPFFEQHWPRFLDSPGFPISRHFRGRLRERRTLSEWLSRRGRYGEQPILAIWGIGGMGKSSLTWLWAKHDVCGEEIPGLDDGIIDHSCDVELGWRPQRTLWFSFYHTEGGGIFNQFLLTALDFFSAGTITLDPDDISGRIDYSSVATQVLRLLRDNRSLVIWDGAERLLNEYNVATPSLAEERQFEALAADQKALQCSELRVAQFLWSICAQSTSKLLLSSRLPFWDLQNRAGAAETDLRGLEPEVAAEVLRSLGVHGPLKVLQEEARQYDFHPQSLEHLATLLQDGSVTADKRGIHSIDTGVPIQGRRTHILDLAYRRRPDLQQRLLAFLAAMRGAIPYGLVLEVAASLFDINSTAVTTSLTSLARHRLISRSDDSGTYDLHPVVRHFAYSQLRHKRDAHLALRSYFARQRTKDTDMTIDHVAATVEIFYHSARAGEMIEAFNIMREQLWRRLFIQRNALASLGALMPELLRESDDIAQPLGRLEKSWTLNRLASVRRNTGDLTGACELIARAIDIDSDPQSELSLSRDFGNLGGNRLFMGHLQEAQSRFEYRVAIAKKLDRLQDEAFGHWDLGRVLAYMGKFDDAERSFEECQTVLDNLILVSEDSLEPGYPTAVEMQTFLWMMRATARLLESDAPTALTYASRAYTRSTELDDRYHVAQASFLMGASLGLSGDSDRSLHFLERALALCDSTGFALLVPQIKTEMAKTLSQVQSLDRARHVALDALEVSARSGYRLAMIDSQIVLADIALRERNKAEAVRYATEAKAHAMCDSVSHHYAPAMLMATNQLRAAAAL